MWRWTGVVVVLVLGCGRTPPSAVDAGPCARALGHVTASEPLFKNPLPVNGFAPWNHQRRHRSDRSFSDLTLWEKETWSPPAFDNTTYPGSSSSLRLVLDTLSTPGGMEFATTPVTFSPARASIYRGRFDDARRVVIYDLLASSDAGSYLHGATLRANGTTLMCASFVGGDLEPAPTGRERLVMLEYGTDAGVRAHATSIPLELCRELVALDGGLLAYALESWFHEPAENVSPHLRSRLVQLGSRYELVSDSRLDAGFCALDTRDALGGWCEALTRDEVLRYDSWKEPPRSVFRHDGGVTVIANVEGHLLVGVNEQHLGDGYARYDIGWLNGGRFQLIRSAQVVPVGYGAWDAGTAALTFIRPDIEGWDVVEAPYACP